MAGVVSVERIDLTLGDGVATATANLTKGQDEAKCVPFATFQHNATANANSDNYTGNMGEVEIWDNSGTAAIRVTRIGTSDPLVYTIYVVEYGDDINVQRGTVNSITGIGTTVTGLGAVTMAKTFVLFYYQRNAGDADAHDSAAVSSQLSSTTTIDLTRTSSADGDFSGWWYVVEDTASNWDVQRGSMSLGTAATSVNSSAFTAVNTAKTFVIASQRNDQADDDVGSGSCHVDLNATTTVRARRTQTTATITIEFQVVEFDSGGAENVYRGDLSFGSGDTQLTASHTTIDPDFSVAWSPQRQHRSGSGTGGGSSDNSASAHKIIINGTDNGIIADRNNFGADASTSNWEVIEWEEAGSADVSDEEWAATEGKGTQSSLFKKVWFDYPYFSFDPEPIPPIPEEITLDKYWTPFSEPLQVKFNAALDTFFIIDADSLTQPETPQLDKWFSPLGEPVRVKQPLPIGGYQHFTIDPFLLTQPEEIPLDKYWQPLSSPVLTKKPLATAAYPYFTIDPDALTRPETTLLNKWFEQFPTPRKRINQTHTNIATSFYYLVGDDPSAVEFAGTQVFGQEEPPYHRRWTWVYSVNPATIKAPSLSTWFVPLSEPLQELPRSAAALFAGNLFSGDPSVFVEPEVVTLDKWFEPLGIGRRKARAPDFPTHSFVWPAPATGGDEVTVDKWLVPLSEPIRVQPFNPAALDQSSWFDFNEAATAPEEVTVDKWFAEFSEPYSAILRAVEFPQPIIDGESLTQPEFTSLDKWWQPAGEPVRVKKVPNVGETLSLPPSEEVNLDKWFVPLSEPTLPQFLLTALQWSFDVDSFALTQPEETRVDKWFSPLSSPVLVKKPLPVAAKPSSWIDPEALLEAEVTTLDRWFSPLSEPVLPKHQTREGEDYFDPRPIIPDSSNWFVALNEPPRGKRIHARHIQSFAFQKPIAAPGGDPNQLDKWFVPLSEPVRPINNPLTTRIRLAEFQLAVTIFRGTLSLDATKETTEALSAEKETSQSLSATKTTSESLSADKETDESLSATKSSSTNLSGKV